MWALARRASRRWWGARNRVAGVGPALATGNGAGWGIVTAVSLPGEVTTGAWWRNGVGLRRARVGLRCGELRGPMLHYAVVFLVIALIAAVLGFGGIAGTAAWLAKVCFIVFLVLAILSFLKRK